MRVAGITVEKNQLCIVKNPAIFVPSALLMPLTASVTRIKACNINPSSVHLRFQPGCSIIPFDAVDLHSYDSL